ncbi:GNAT family N-acetyltransferase [Nitrincola schmidtii]|uniref:GNAT family N-acetyltransferase n=1 Tax=Nitrincola schmidtii TaxID=1730894 RepID=UPI00124CE0EC|nr:GNAT family N-acetyltransferase [Nitrincola schmidtii]
MANRHFSQAFRSFYWIPVDEHDIDVALSDCLRQLPCVSDTLLISDNPLLTMQSVNSRDAIRWLGRDTDRIIFNAYSGFNPNAFAQVCGTLKGGGELILITPKADQWIKYEDPEYQALRGSRFADYHFTGNFIRHLIQHLAAFTPASSELADHTLEEPYLSQQQANLVTRLVTDFGLPESTQVITADRGRGKTAALGLALAKLVSKAQDVIPLSKQLQPLNVVVTAPSRDALDSLFNSLKSQLPDGELTGSGFQHRLLSLRFYPPAVLLQKYTQADLVIVDEAAAIPVFILQQIQQLGSRHWYATTLHGYEGNGRGFELRFLAWLIHQQISYQTTHLTDPVRWAAGDPLELLSYRLLLLDAEPADECSTSINYDDLQYITVPQSALVDKQDLLQQIFGLLIAAHYRTTPNDLRQLLDSPDLSIRVLMHQQTPVAVALLIEEGPLAEDLIEPIWSGYRRPSGDLIPQTLVSREGFRQAGYLRGWRVMRVAVHPKLQRLGLGSRLLENIQQEALKLQLDFCGASFAADPRLFGFWHANHYHPLRLGERSDRVTAGWPLLVLNPLSESAQKISQEILRNFSERLVLKLTLTASRSEQLMLMHCLAALTDNQALAVQETEIVQGFALHQRSIDDSLLCLRKWLVIPENMKLLLSWPEIDQQLMIGRIFQLKSAQILESETGLSGKRAQLKRLRILCKKLISNSDEQV